MNSKHTNEQHKYQILRSENPFSSLGRGHEISHG